MLEHVPAWLGHAMKGMRAGSDKLCIAQLHGDFAAVRLSSPAFANGGAIPARFTADGEGVSPPLLWEQVPEGVGSFALIVEDPDAPAPQPLVHATVWNIGAEERGLAEGAIGDGGRIETGRNSYFFTGWLPPDPPTGHGPHNYSFQLFALDSPLQIEGKPGRSKLVDAMKGKVVAAGLLTGTYSRGEPALTGRAGVVAAASRTG